jgi:hypothetical protein
MKVSVDICLRGNDYATTEEIEGVSREPRDWIDEDVRTVLEGMLRAMDRSRRPGEAARGVLLRGLSWIVNPFEEGGVVIAIEITLGAAVAGPFEIEKAALEAMIARVIAQAVPPSASIH